MKRLELSEEEVAVVVEALGVLRRRYSSRGGYKRGPEAEELYRKSAAIADLRARFQEPDDPMTQYISQQVLDDVKAGRCAVVLDESGQDEVALVPMPFYRAALGIPSLREVSG